MDKESKLKYEGHKLVVKRWEREFKNTNNRIPSKVSEIKVLFSHFLELNLTT